MAGLLIGWGIGTFVYFKIVMDWVFDADITLTAAALITALEAALAIFVTGLHAVQLLNYDWTRSSLLLGFRTAVARTALVLVATILFDIVCARLVVYGFSKDLNLEIQNFCRSGCFVHGTILRFSLIVTVPLLLHYAIMVVGTYRTAR
ncbi:hypothetical protein [Mesorhizobium sp. ORS 3428]|uniref:hypothetical protein n=1 Tax=Mesorhizobium sp. ORS 3428 TaxID=540997 RepID=UPI0008DA13D0|nr:hypothetical protein [Mesorhizobium sp. ORS 3428]OHV81981.1 hypothetical protein ORS3428_27440 [Mesorhizobium sp. ORS 3428]